MTRRRIAVPLTAAVLFAGCVTASPASAPPGSADGAATAIAGRSDTSTVEAPIPAVVSVRLAVRPATLRVGDTTTVAAVAIGPDGTPVPGVAVRVRASRRSFEVIDDGARIVALREGDGVVTAEAVRDERSVPGAPVASVPLRASPAPLAGLDLEVPRRMLAGSRGEARAVARTAHGPRERAPDVRWRSSDTSVVRVGAFGDLTAAAPGTARLVAAAEDVTADAVIEVVGNPVRRLELSPGTAHVEAGEVVHLTATPFDTAGLRLDGIPVEWAVGSAGDAPDTGGEVDPGGAFVANRPGTYRVAAIVGSHVAVSVIHASSRPPVRPVRVVGHRRPPAGAGSTTDLSVFEGVDGRDYVYTGTLTAATLYAWDVTVPSAPVLVDSVKLPGRRVNDVKIGNDATLAIATSEGAADRRNGITLLDILDPAHPRILTHVTENLTGGVHNVWIEDDLVYAVHDGTQDLQILDVSDPSHPRVVGRWGLESPGRSLHDVTIRDGLAYLSYWNDGLVILDVGAGIAGGTPTEPRFVSRYVYAVPLGGETFGNTHHAVRYRDWVFVADEIFGCRSCGAGPRGYVHVLDVADLENPREVARYELPEAGAHNLWAEDERLYVAYSQAGVRVLDISGELRGDLRRQGREIARFSTGSPDAEVPNAPMAWGPQPFKGRLFVSDRNSGLWVLQIEEDRP